MALALARPTASVAARCVPWRSHTHRAAQGLRGLLPRGVIPAPHPARFGLDWLRRSPAAAAAIGRCARRHARHACPDVVRTCLGCMVDACCYYVATPRMWLQGHPYVVAPHAVGLLHVVERTEAVMQPTVRICPGSWPPAALRRVCHTCASCGVVRVLVRAEYGRRACVTNLPSRAPTTVCGDRLARQSLVFDGRTASLGLVQLHI